MHVFISTVTAIVLLCLALPASAWMYDAWEKYGFDTWIEGWSVTTNTGFQGITNAVRSSSAGPKGAYQLSLQCDLRPVPSSHRAGKVEVDMQDVMPLAVQVPVDMDGHRIYAIIKAYSGTGGNDPQYTNRWRMFVKDEFGRCTYAGWQRANAIWNDYYFQVGTNSAYGETDPGFDPARVTGLGLHLAMPSGSTGTYAGSSFYIDNIRFDAAPALLTAPTNQKYTFDSDDEGFVCQTYTDSRACTNLVQTTAGPSNLSGCLAIDMHLVGGHANYSKGEVYVDMSGNLPTNTPDMEVPLDLSGKHVETWVYCPAGMKGPGGSPNGVQMLCKDSSWKTYYGSWEAITEDCWFNVSMAPSATAPNHGYVDSGFDPTSIRFIGLKVGTGGSSSNHNYDGSMYVDAFSFSTTGDYILIVRTNDVRYSFEPDQQGWRADDYLDITGVVAVAQSTNYGLHGTQALRLDMGIRNAGTNRTKGAAKVDMRWYPPPTVRAPFDLEGREINAYVYCPEGTGGSGGQVNEMKLFVQSGTNFAAEYSAPVTMRAGKWVELKLTPSTTAPPGGWKAPGFTPTNITGMGLECSMVGTYTGALYLDNICFETDPPNLVTNTQHEYDFETECRQRWWQWDTNPEGWYAYAWTNTYHATNAGVAGTTALAADAAFAGPGGAGINRKGVFEIAFNPALNLSTRDHRLIQARLRFDPPVEGLLDFTAGLQVFDKITDQWYYREFNVGGSDWNTLTFDLDNADEYAAGSPAGPMDASAIGFVAIQLYANAGWTGTVYVDDIVLGGTETGTNYTPITGGFVQTDGSRFTLNGSNFYHCGANIEYLQTVTDAICEEMLDLASSCHVHVVRTWAMQEGHEYSFQPERGVWNELMFEHLDRIVAMAGDRGIRLMLGLCDNWGHNGGVFQYLRWVKEEHPESVNTNLPEESVLWHDQFWTNTWCKQWYRDYVTELLTRTNTITGVAYRDDPTIFAWEIINEPRCESDYTGRTIHNWLHEMSDWVRTIDTNHLLGGGEEGGYVNTYAHAEKVPWETYPDNYYHYGVHGLGTATCTVYGCGRGHGVEFISDHSSTSNYVQWQDGTYTNPGTVYGEWRSGNSNLNFCTIRIYQDEKEYNLWRTNANGHRADQRLEWINDHWWDAHARIGKPMLLEEFGLHAAGWVYHGSYGEKQFKRNPAYDINERAEAFDLFYRLTENAGIAGSYFWNFGYEGMWEDPFFTCEQVGPWYAGSGAGTGVSTSTNFFRQGARSLKLAYNTSATNKAVFVCPTNESWVVRVKNGQPVGINRARFTWFFYNPGDTISAALALRGNGDWDWAESPKQILTTGWNRVVFDLTAGTWACADGGWAHNWHLVDITDSGGTNVLEAVHEVDIVFYDLPAGTGEIYMDDIRIRRDDGFVVYADDPACDVIRAHADRMTLKNTAVSDPANHAPEAPGTTLYVSTNEANVFTLPHWDEDGDPLSFRIMERPTNGWVFGIPPTDLVYECKSGATGGDRFTYVVFDGKEESATGTIHVHFGGEPTNYHYVSLSGSHTFPYESWATAATTIQAAVDAATDGDIVRVADGTYDRGGTVAPGATYPLTNRVMVNKPIRIESVNGPDSTTIVGAEDPVYGGCGSNAVRGVYLTDGSILTGFTIQDGYTWRRASSSERYNSGGGVLLDGGGSISNCVIKDCSTYYYGLGGGICLYRGGRVYNCTLNDCAAGRGGGIALYRAGRATDCYIEHCRQLGGNMGSGICIYYGTATVTRCTITDCYEDYGQWAAAVGSYYAQSTYSDCVITGNTGRGLFCLGEGSIEHCVLSDNGRQGLYMYSGGIGPGGTATHCDIQRNAEGGVILERGGTLNNCTIVNNTKDDKGGGVCCYHSGTINNCTIVGNSAGSGGGLYLYSGGTVQNSIIYHNEAPVNPNYHHYDTGMTYANCCITPDPGGAGNVTTAPLVAGADNPHLLSGSPCIDAGDNNFAAGISVDVDGETRIADGIVDIGCDEYLAAGMTGALAVAIGTDFTTAVVGATFAFEADIDGKPQQLVWTLQTESGWDYTTNQTGISRTWTAAGSYDVVLSAWNNSDSAATTVSVQVLNGSTNYVSPGGAHVAPYTSWTNAATTIQAAVDAAVRGAVVLVNDGTYFEAAQVTVGKALTVRSVNGPAVTIVDGSDAHRCFNVTDPGVTLEGFTITNGNVGTYGDGGGVYAPDGGTVRHCVISGNTAGDGSGAYGDNGALFEFCDISGNLGCAVHVESGAEARSCYIHGNNTGNSGYSNSGGGVYCLEGGLVNNCAVVGNAANLYGGGVYCSRGTVENCTIINNQAPRGAGLDGYQATIRNTIIYHNGGAEVCNWAGSSMSFSHCCTLPDTGDPAGIIHAPRPAGIANPHLLASSPCRNAGENAWATNLTTDFEGESRIADTTVDIGCDEYVTGSVTGPMAVAIGLPTTNVTVNTPLTLTALTQGKIRLLCWNVDVFPTGFYSNERQISDAALIRHAWSMPGDHEVRLGVWNESGYTAATVTVHVVASQTNFVAVTGAHTPPFTNWATAATNLQAAINAACAGGVVMVASGTYGEADGVTIDKALTLTGVNGRDATILDGSGAHPCLRVSAADVILQGLTFFDGDAGAGYEHGGGLFASHPVTLSGCAAVSNNADYMGGGLALLAGGMLDDCRLAGNHADIYGGGAYVVGACLTNCVIEANRVDHCHGGGLYMPAGGRLDNCELRKNSSGTTVGGASCGNCIVTNCLVISNSATFGPGGISMAGGLLTDCEVMDNGAGGSGCGGMSCSAGAVVRNTEIRGNNGCCPGGIKCTDSAVVEYCIIDDNSTDIGNAGGARCESGGIIRNCTIRNNNAGRSGGGVQIYNGGIVLDCLIVSNTADMKGGGVMIEDGLIEGCEIAHNNGQSGGGILCGGNETINSCLVRDNYAGYAPPYYYDGCGGGIWAADDSTINNCTLIDNSASHGAAGLYCGGAAAVHNSIMYYNTRSGAADNWDGADTNATYAYCCTTPMPPGSGHLTNAPGLVSVVDGHLLPDSDCIDAGWNSYAASIDYDIDGEDRIANATVDIGCDEYHAGGAGGLSAGIGANSTTAAAGAPLGFVSEVEGHADGILWEFGDAAPEGGPAPGGRGPSYQERVANRTTVEYAWDTAGEYQVILTASNQSCTAAATITVHIAEQVTHYVALNGAHVSPFTSWSNAATSIIAALSAAAPGDRVLVTNGVYYENTTIAPTCSLWLAGVSGPESTIIDAQNGHRCLLFKKGMTMEGFTLRNGESGNGGGVYLDRGGCLKRCILYGNLATNDGGGVYSFRGGQLSDCLIVSNSAAIDGGGMYACQGGMLNNCTLADNSTGVEGGGLYSIGQAIICNSICAGNTAGVSGPEYTDADGAADFLYCCAWPAPNGIGNIDFPPTFDTGYRLLSNSPCINAGHNLLVDELLDLSGAARIANGRVDIGAYECSTVADSDSDGLPDAYEMTHGLDASMGDADGDADGDGMSNLREWLAGTDINNIRSCFVNDCCRYSPTGVTIQITTAPGMQYTVYYADSPDLSAGLTFTPFSNTNNGVGTWLETGNREGTFTFHDDFTAGTSGSAPADGKRYYRVRGMRMLTP
jgi:hypothetical protein